MRRVGRIAVFALFGVLALYPGRAAQGCENTLGVSRTIEVDTTGGPWFGTPQGDPNFLAPGEVVLTFDDGPAPRSTRAILAALAAECTKATFFVLGEMAAAHPDVVREMDAQGHTIGTHTWSHPNLRRLSDEKMRGQIEAAFIAAETGAGHPIAPFFRYPYLSHTPAGDTYLQSRNIAQFAIDIDSLDWRSRNAQSIVRRIAASLNQRGKGIILLHDIHPSTAAALPAVLAWLKSNGFRVVHLRPKAPAATVAGYEVPASKEHRYAAPARRRVVHAKPALTGWKWPAW